MFAALRIIEPFQKGETPTFASHAKAGLNALMENDRGLLVFSGYVMSYVLWGRLTCLSAVESVLIFLEAQPKGQERNSVKGSLISYGYPMEKF